MAMYKRIKIIYWFGCLLFLMVFYRWVMPNETINFIIALVNIILFIALSESFIHYRAIPYYFYKKKYIAFFWSILGCFLINSIAALLVSWTILQPHSNSQYNALFWAWENLIYGVFL